MNKFYSKLSPFANSGNDFMLIPTCREKNLTTNIKDSSSADGGFRMTQSFNPIKILTIFLFLTSFAVNTSAQEIQLSVNVNVEPLAVQYREYLTSFKNLIEDYVNKNRWTDVNWTGPKIPLTMSILFRSASSSNRYSAQVVITSQRPIYGTQKVSLMLKHMDTNWDFIYDRNQTLYFNPNMFDPLTSFLEYYVYIALGLDFDSYEQAGGTAYFSKALSIANQGASSSFSGGWQKGEATFSRSDFVSEILNEKYQDFRKSYFEYHYNGLDLQSENPKAPASKLVQFIKTIEELRAKVFSRSMFLRVFFDTKYLEFCEVLSNYRDKNIFETLKKIDPAHISAYEEHKKK
ncbi:MAG: DUF4835 family protein [Bacteroidetes bacterium]|nr:DUF4835 family protein [Bacteroidota bacterium]MBU2583698.1 DUF4835 family protein [Bacteroidota bacterium]